MTALDPGIYGDFRQPLSRPRRIRDRCPECGAAIEWGDIHADTGEGSERRWIGATAECGCGLELRWDPNQTARVEARRSAASAAHHGELASDQLPLV